MLNVDVITLICEELEFGTSRCLDRTFRTTEDLNCRKGLLSLGLSSKTFLEPALDVLWRTLNRVEPLLSVLPETVSLNGKKMIMKQIALPSWDRLHYYASRVRIFKDDGTDNVHESVYAILGQSKPIFPKLAQLLPGTQICTYSLVFFLTSSISRAVIPSPYFPQSEHLDFGPSLALLASKSPGLRSLFITTTQFSGISASLRGFRELEDLHLGRLPQYEKDYIQSLASLTKLTYLNLTLLSDDSFDYVGLQNSFPSLKQLSIIGSSSELHNFLKIVTPLSLQILSLTWHGDPSIIDAIDVTTSLGRFSSLQNLNIDNATSLFVVDPDRERLWSLFNPLLKLTQIRSLRYSSPLFLTDQITATIASSWPHAETLHFTAVSWSEIPPVSSLAHFARECPNLDYLQYPIQIDVSPGAADPIPPTPFMHPLRDFICSVHYDVLDPLYVALSLHQIFPSLKNVSGDGDKWDEVKAILESYHLILAQDRRSI
ncbi:MAG: hypothetical protein NXY57DRAFT_19552 [Lentinula lateritia]|uniref:F-box domain-containing protein n=1 Tax=Lentinula lateritia TaxID=40482 RepID=A0ABQ8V078_9AGAR|nr:MAG: hypothetical protein NXY57DRAFT_19552 [Lentinula lateritia]KAJ4467790.1 hypothetical protein C8R41DRAFT_855126 [Lentinula lateritia]